MYVDRREVLQERAGSLSQVPLPLLLHALASQERSAILELRLRHLEKRVFFEDGVPVGCASNLSHESLGMHLVTKGKLTEAQLHALLAESAAGGRPLETLLLERQVLSGSELFKSLQANLAHALLDVFRWEEGAWRLLDPEPVATPIRMNTAQLVFMGVLQLPAAALEQHFPLSDDEVLALVPGAGNPAEELKLSPKDTRLLSALRRRATVGALCATQGLQADEVRRRLYALCVLGFADLAAELDARAAARGEAPAPVPPPSISAPSSPGLGAAPPPPPAPPPPSPWLDEDEAAQNLLANEYLSVRTRDAFEVLGVDVDAQGAPLQKAFLAKCEALPPARFRGAEARAKAEVLLCAYARAFGALADVDQWHLHRKRREARDAQRRAGAKGDGASEHFRIRTRLLDAGSQFEEGRRLAQAGNLKAAVDHFQYAVDIEPRGRFRAWLAYTRYRLQPSTLEAALGELAQACTQEPACEEAWAWRGDLATALGRHAEAEEAYRQAYRLGPTNPRYPSAIKAAMELRGRRP